MRADRPARRRPAEGRLLRRRRVPVDLRLPARRRRGLPRAARGRGAAAAADARTTARGRRCSPRSTTSSARSSATATSRSPRRASSPTRCSATRSSCSSPTSATSRTLRCAGARRGAGTIARRVRELVDAGVATAGEIVLLFAAGTDAERYEEELRARGPADLPRDRPPLLRPAAGRRPAARTCGSCATATTTRRSSPCSHRRSSASRTTGSSCPSSRRPAAALHRHRALAARALLGGRRAARPRVQATLRAARRGVGAHEPRASLRADRLRARLRPRGARAVGREAPLREPAQADAARALVRVAARAATSRASSSFIRDQEAVGAAQLEAVSEEEGADAVRLLTIHAAKGLEFKVVIVADAGRDTGGPPSADEIIVRPDGRFGFRVVDPKSGKKRPVLDYEAVREAEREDERAERLRLYYVAMTRAIDRLIVSGRDRPGEDARSRHADRLGALDGSASATSRSDGRARARRRDGSSCACTATSRICRPSRSRAGRGSWRCSRSCRAAPAPRGYRLPELPPLPPAPLHKVQAPLVLGARALRALLVPLLRRARRGPARGAGHAAGRGGRAARDRDRRRGASPARARRPVRAGASRRVGSFATGTRT